MTYCTSHCRTVLSPCVCSRLEELAQQENGLVCTHPVCMSDAWANVGLIQTGCDSPLNCFQYTTSLSTMWITGNITVAVAVSPHNTQHWNTSTSSNTTPTCRPHPHTVDTVSTSTGTCVKPARGLFPCLHQNVDHLDGEASDTSHRGLPEWHLDWNQGAVCGQTLDWSGATLQGIGCCWAQCERHHSLTGEVTSRRNNANSIGCRSGLHKTQYCCSWPERIPNELVERSTEWLLWGIWHTCMNWVIWYGGYCHCELWVSNFSSLFMSFSVEKLLYLSK